MSHIPQVIDQIKTVHDMSVYTSVPARLGKGQGAKEIGHNLARERPKFSHNPARV